MMSPSFADETRRHYLAALLAHAGTLHLPLRSLEQTLPFQSIYQPLTLRHGPFSFEAPPHEAVETITARTGAEALSHSPLQRMVVLGGPGMGKTTLLKALLQQAIQAAQRDATAALPLFISLPDLARSGLTLQSYLPSLLNGMGIDTRYGEILQQAVTTGQAFLCLDSLDEVVPAQRPAMITLINHEAIRYGGTWIIGSRFIEYKGGQFLHSQFAEWELQPLDDTLQLEMASHLLPLLSERLQRTPAPDGQAFVDAIQHDGRIAAWGRNPLLLSFAATVYVQAGMLPSSRATLYRDIIGIMLSARTPDSQAQAALRTLLAEVALQLYQTQGRNFSVTELFEILRASDTTRSFQKQTALVEQILASSLLDVVSDQTYGFQHQMFQEYLAAVALAEQLCSADAATHQTAWEFLWRKHTYSRWREVLQLCVGVLVQEHGEPGSQIAAHWLRCLAGEHTTPAGDVGHLCLELAIGSLREFPVALAHVELVQTIRLLILVWAQIYLETNDSRFERLERLAEDVMMLDYHLVLPAITWLEDVRDEKYLEFYALAQRVDNLLSTLKLSIPARVLACAFPASHGISLSASTLTATLRTSASPEALVNLLQDAQEHWSVRVGAAQLLGEWGERTPLGVLSAIAVDPACDYRIRVAAVEALGKQQERIPLEPLVSLLQDPDERMRVSAVEALAATGDRLPVAPFLTAVHDRPSVQNAVVWNADRLTGQVASEPLLQALSDVNGQVRWTAVTLLGQNIPRDRLLALLQDSDGRVRSATITHLGKDIPLAYLMAALQDGEKDMRLAAITQLGKDIPLDALLVALQDSEIAVRLAAVEIAGILGDHVPLAPLLEVLERHDELYPSYTSCDDETDTIHNKLDIIYDKPDTWQYGRDSVWHKAMQVLLQSGRTVPVATLIALAQDPTMLARVFEIALQLQIPLPVELLLAGLFETDDSILLDRAASMLENLGENAPIMTLLTMVCDPAADGEKRLAATRALLQLAPSVPTEPIFTLLEDIDVTSSLYRNLVCLLVRCGAPVNIDILLKALQAGWRDYSPPEPDSTALALVHLGAQAPIEVLLGMLRDDRPHRSYLANYYPSHDRARNVLEHLFETITVPHLQAAACHGIEDEHMALKVLGVMGKHAPIDLIKSILDDERRDRWLRRQARLTLQKAGVLLPLHYLLAEDGLSLELVDYDFPTDSYYPHTLMTIDEVTVAQMRELGPHAPIQDLFTFFDAPYHERYERYERYEQVTMTIIEVLHELAPYLSLAAVVALLDHRNPLARRGAARVLTAFAERAPINKLVAMLQNPKEDQRVRLAILQALSELYAYTPVEALTTLLHDTDVLNDYFFYDHVCDALKPWGKNIPLEPLLALIHNTNSEFDRRPAISALGLLQERAPLDLLLTLLQGEDHFESDCALLALCSLGKDIPLDSVMPYLPGKTNLMGSNYVQAFVALGEDLPLARFFQIVDDQDDHARTWVIKALGDFAEAAPVQFVALAKDDVRPFVRVALMKALAKLGTDAPVDLALAALTDPHPDVRRQARTALLQLSVNPMLIPLEPLLAALQEQGDVQEPGYYRYESNRHQSELALLARCGARVPVAPLLVLLGDLDPDVCENAASALYQTHPEVFGEVAQQAEAILHGEPLAGVFASRVQSRIARRVSLIEHATPEVLALLSDLLAWPYWQVRVEAATTLANIHRNIPDRAIRRLLELRLDPTSQAVREAADHALAEILSRENGMEDE